MRRVIRFFVFRANGGLRCRQTALRTDERQLLPLTRKITGTVKLSPSFITVHLILPRALHEWSEVTMS